MTLNPDTTFSHYKILSEIGKGGMGEVYLAQDTKLNRKVAIKFLSDEFSHDTDKLNRFIQEAQAASALNHPNIVTIHEIGEHAGSRYIALEYIEGETLSKFLRKKLRFESALDIAIQLASALDAAHSAGIVHRDIKPDNVMVRKDGIVKILDFGIAKLSVPGAVATGPFDSEGETAVRVDTSPGMVIGTANYMSPEQAKGKEIDSRTDIFSFGVVLYEMIAGHLPFSGDSPLEIIGSILKDEPKPVGNEEVPAELERIVTKSLRKDPDERYQTMKGLAADLKEFKRQMDFQDQLDKTVQPERSGSATQVFEGTTVSEEQQTTTAQTRNDSISIRKSSFSRAAAALAGVFILVTVGVGYWYIFGSASDQIDSIAVMPFKNESGDSEVEYLSDGMTETLINRLSVISGLKVKARSSVFRFKGKDYKPQAAASELGVQALLIGRIVQRGDQLTLNLELIDPGTENVLWGRRYERKSSELVALQTEITTDVLGQLKRRLSGEDNTELAVSNTEDSEAYKLYLKGRYYAAKRTGKDLLKSLEFYNQAVAEDPNYALAHTGLAESYGVLSIYGVSTPRETMPKAREAARKALALNDNLAEAHSALGNVLARYDFNFPEAEREFQRAIEVNPKYGFAHNWYAELLSNLRRHDEAIRSIQRALEIDPLSLTFNRVYALILYNAGRLDEAEAQYRKTIELDENYAVTYVDLGALYEVRKEYAKAAEVYIKSYELSGNRERAAELRKAFDKGGWTGYLRKQIEFADSGTGQEFYEGATTRLFCFISLGENEKALDELDKIYEMRKTQTVAINVEPLFAPLREEPRFKELVRKVGFPE